MAITGTVPSTALNVNTLRARDYLWSPRNMARTLVTQWVEEEGLSRLLRRDAPAVEALTRRVEEVLREVLEPCASEAHRLE